MNCKNCGARIDMKSGMCQNCGARLSEADYVLLTADDRIPEIYNSPKRRRNFLKPIISIILVIAIFGAGGYYLYNLLAPKDKPEIEFTTGYGVINGDEPVIYVLVPENSKIQYIHGVTLYSYDKGDESPIADSISTDYEYTKNIDDTFRAIFFDTQEFNIGGEQEYTYTFEMNFSFVNNNEIFTYNTTIKFPGSITGDVSDIVFDHSMEKETTTEAQTTEPTTAPTTTTTTAQPTTPADVSFIYENFWFTEPISGNTDYNISAIKFENNGNCKITNYYKDGNTDWKVATYNASYEINGTEIYVTDTQGMTESYAIDSAGKKLDGLEQRKFNSIKNAEDFFGI